ncbi:hypothetical protein RchiOBHm_Chr6g0256551 [Rosa chinensis]|uniref:Uncharacterized protein n=1 Tax=Rosa chinensis TaxID=74649 RepID=A0A2P6PM59_ROSCH|nr:hypothetical protein RchiOBHm_Chr6g0256551 [Rosa chinensis]
MLQHQNLRSPSPYHNPSLTLPHPLLKTHKPIFLIFMILILRCKHFPNNPDKTLLRILKPMSDLNQLLIRQSSQASETNVHNRVRFLRIQPIQTPLHVLLINRSSLSPLRFISFVSVA